MKKHEEVTARLFVEQLKRMNDAQFLSYMATITDTDHENPIISYMAKRLDAIAMIIEAGEVKDEWKSWR